MDMNDRRITTSGGYHHHYRYHKSKKIFGLGYHDPQYYDQIITKLNLQAREQEYESSLLQDQTTARSSRDKKNKKKKRILPGNQTMSVMPIDITQLRDQIRSQHPLLAAISDKIQTMDIKDTLRYTIGVDIVASMLKSHAKQLMMNQTAGNQTMLGNQTATP